MPPVAPDPELESYRIQIDEIDNKILELVAARVRVVLKVGDFKRKRGLKIYDPDRERLVLERLSSRAPEPLDRNTVKRIFERLIDESRRIEQHHVSEVGRE